MDKIEELLKFLEDNCYKNESCKFCEGICKFKKYLELKNDKNRKCD